MSEAPMDAYTKAIEEYKACKLNLAMCEIELDVLRIAVDKDAVAHRKALSKQKSLQACVDKARGNVRDAVVAVVRDRGMEPREVKEGGGLLQQIVAKIMEV